MAETIGSEQRARRLFLDKSPHALLGKEKELLEIKTKIASHFGCEYIKIFFCGSAQLGFSPLKDKDFSSAESDLDVAIIDPTLFQDVWRDLLKASRAFNDLTVFPRTTNVGVVREMISKRCLIHLHDMPWKLRFIEDRKFSQRLSLEYTDLFKQINISFYLGEYAFVWKQASAFVEFERT